MTTNTIHITNPFSYLKKEHREVAKMLRALDDTTERAVKTRLDIFQTLNDSLTRHADLEEEVVYPVLQVLHEARDLTFEAHEEHKEIKTLLTAMTIIPPDDEVWTAKMTLLKENIEHHVKEEETQLMPKAQKELDENDMRLLAEKMEAFLNTR